jgi:hypothetical protein
LRTSFHWPPAGNPIRYEWSFGGKSDAVEFGGLIGPLTIGVNIPLKEIAVFNFGEKIADFHLGPAAPGTYSAANFSVHNNALIYHHS